MVIGSNSIKILSLIACGGLCYLYFNDISDYVFSFIYMYKHNKVVVFDLDETLGHFSELGLFCKGIQDVLNIKLSQEDFFKILDLYPEFLRPDIIKIINYVKKKKIDGKCEKVLIYTNNNGPPSWAKKIKNYFEYKIQYKLFDQIIGAYKIKGVMNEPGRTSHNKTYSDLIQCSKFKKNKLDICFIDDQYHPGMIHKNIYYIYLPGYQCQIPLNEMMRRFINSSIGNKYIHNSNTFTIDINNYMSQYNIECVKKDITPEDIELSKKLLYYIKQFFKHSYNNKTRKRYIQSNDNNKTRKRL